MWLCLDYRENLNDMLGELFLATEAPEAPKQGFLKSLFTGGSNTLDREELCEYSAFLETLISDLGDMLCCNFVMADSMLIHV